MVAEPILIPGQSNGENQRSSSDDHTYAGSEIRQVAPDAT